MDQFAESCGDRRIGGPARLPVARMARHPAAARRRARRLPHGLAAPPRWLGVQPAAEPVRGGRRRVRGARPGDPKPARRHARRCSRGAGDRLDPVAYAARRARRHRERPRARRPSTRSRPATRRPSAACSPRAMPRCATGSRSAPRSSTRWSRSRPSVPGVIAARMTGAGFGGCTVNLVRPDAVEALRAAVDERYPAMTGLRPDGLRRSTPPTGPAGSPERAHRNVGRMPGRHHRARCHCVS